jgi:hypothetical protein
MYWDQNGTVTPKPPGATFGGCPANLLTQNTALNRYIRGTGGEYGADILERFSISNPTGATIYWLMSTWNPYRVIVQRTVVTAP